MQATKASAVITRTIRRHVTIDLLGGAGRWRRGTSLAPGGGNGALEIAHDMPGESGGSEEPPAALFTAPSPV
jgi:hypothetical protein